MSFARGTVFSSNTTTIIRILRRHVRQFWYLPAAGEAAAAVARGLAAWCFSSADVREFLGAVLAAAAAAASNKIYRKETLGTLWRGLGIMSSFKGMLFFLWQVIFFEPAFLLKVFMLRGKADKKAGIGRLLLLCMPFRSAVHAAIGLFVFAFDAPKFIRFTSFFVRGRRQGRQLLNNLIDSDGLR